MHNSLPCRSHKRAKEEDEEAVYEMVVEDSEIDYIGKVFSELLEDIDISK